MVRELMHVHDAQKGGHVERHKFTENRDPARPRATFGADCLTCNEGMMHPNHDPVPMDHHLRSDCRICGDRVYSLDDHLRSHERPAAGDEDARGGAPRP